MPLPLPYVAAARHEGSQVEGHSTSGLYDSLNQGDFEFGHNHLLKTHSETSDSG